MRLQPIVRYSREQLRVIELDPQADPRWEAFVSIHPDGLIYHHPAWLQALEHEYGHRLVALACESGDGRLRGILPLLPTRGIPFPIGDWRTGRRLSSLPRTPVAGPLALDTRASEVLVRAAIERAQRVPGSRLELKILAPDLDGLVEGLLGTPWRLTYRLTLCPDPADLRLGSAQPWPNPMGG